MTSIVPLPLYMTRTATDGGHTSVGKYKKIRFGSRQGNALPRRAHFLLDGTKYQ